MSDPTPVGVPVCYRHPDRETHIRCQRCSRPICPDCMTGASVGFQCPECVREGQKSVRQPKRFTGARVSFRALPVTFSLIGVNVLVWIAVTATGGNGHWLTEYLAIRFKQFCMDPAGNIVGVPRESCVNAAEFGAVWMPGVDGGAFWQVITSVFTHVAILHLAVNMLSLYMLGSFLEPILGRSRYLAAYLISGVAGSALIVWATGLYSLGTVGASGAIFGLMGVLVVLFLRAGQSLAPLLPVLLINAGITFFGNGISWQGHVGGFVGGLAVAAILTYGPLRNDRRVPLLWLSLGALTLVLLAVIGVRVLLF